MSMFFGPGINKMFKPFFSDPIICNGNRKEETEERSFHFQTSANVYQDNLIDGDTGLPSSDRLWTIEVLFDFWTDSTDPKIGDEIYLVNQRSFLRVDRVELHRDESKFVLICSESKKKLRNGF